MTTSLATRTEYDHTDLARLLNLPQQSNAEGYVIRFKGGMRVKVKHDDYTRLHRVLTNVTARRLFEIAVRDDLQRKGYSNKAIAYVLHADPSTIDSIPSFLDILERVPDEFYAWVKRVEQELETAYFDRAIEVQRDFDRATNFARKTTLVTDDERTFRRQFAVFARRSSYSDALFKMLQGDDPSAIIWKSIRPAHEKPFNQQSEDVA